MPLSEYLAAMGDGVSPGDDIRNVVCARRMNAIIGAIQALARGENIVKGNGVVIKRSPTGAVVSALPASRTGTGGPRLVSVEVTLDANTPPTSAQINATLLAYYTDGTVPREGDTFRISRVDNHYPEVEVRLTKTELGPDWRFAPSTIIEIQEKDWYRIVRDISGRTYFESSASKATTNEDGVEVTNKTEIKTLLIDPAEITADMVIRDLPVVVGSEIKLARVIASEPVSQDPVVNLPGGQEYLEGGGIRFLDSLTDAKYITVYLPELADDEDQDGATLIKLEYVPATLPGGAEGVRLKYSSRITDNVDSHVRLYTEDEGETWYFELDEDTLELLESLSDIVERVETLETDLATAQDDIDTLQGQVSSLTSTVGSLVTTVGGHTSAISALQSDVVTMDGRLDSAEADISSLQGAQETIFGLIIDHGSALDDLNTAISGAAIECDESGVTLTWGT